MARNSLSYGECLNESRCLSGGDGDFGLSSGAGLSCGVFGLSSGCLGLSAGPASSAHTLRLVERLVSRGGVLLGGGRRYAAAAALTTAIGLAAIPEARALDIYGFTVAGLNVDNSNPGNNPMSVFAGGIASNTSIGIGGNQYILAGGLAIETYVSAGGGQAVRDGGTANSTTLNSGGEQSIYDNGIAISTTINNSGYQSVYSGGSAIGTTINSGGTQIIYDNGSASGTTINSAGWQYVSANGSAIGTMINDGGHQNVLANGSAISTTINNSGCQSVYSGGSAIGTTINNGGTQSVYSSGVVSGTTINNGGYQSVYNNGSAVSTTINNGGVQYVSSAGVANGTIINGGTQHVSSGGSAVGTTINSGGSQLVASNGSASGTIINSGGRQYASSAGSAFGTIISSGGTQYIHDAGSAIGTTINAGGWQNVFSSGVAAGTTISSGGLQSVYDNGIASGTIVNAGGVLYAGSGGSVVSLAAPVAGTFQGYGTVSGGVAIASGGCLAAGGAYDPSSTSNYGSMTVSGNLTVSPGGVIAVRVDSASPACDSVAVVNGGIANINGATISHVAPSGALGSDFENKSWTVLTATGGVTGTAVGTTTLAFYALDLDYSNPLAFSFGLKRLPFSHFASSFNQYGVAAGLTSLEALGLTGSLADVILGLGYTPQQIASLYDQLSGEMHASLTGGLMLLDRDFSRWILDHSGRQSLARTILSASASGSALASIHPQALESRFANDFRADVGYVRQGVDGDGNAGRHTLKGPEVSLGYDHIAPSGWLGGAAFRYGDREMKAKSRLSEADIDSYSLAAHGGFQAAFGPGAARFILGGVYTRHDIDGRRHVDIGATRQRLESRYHANSYQLFLEGAYAAPVGGIWLEPFADLAWTAMRVPGFTETGGNAALRAHSQSQNNLAQLLGMRLVLPAFNRINLEAQAGWRHTYGKLDKVQAFAFAEGGDSFGIKGSKLNRDEAILDLRADYAVRDNIRVGLEANAAAGERGTSLRGGAFIALEW